MVRTVRVGDFTKESAQKFAEIISEFSAQQSLQGSLLRVGQEACNSLVAAIQTIEYLQDKLQYHENRTYNSIASNVANAIALDVRGGDSADD